MDVKVEWLGGLKFEAAFEGGATMTLDGEGPEPSPMEALLASLAACSGMDVASILEKKRQHVDSYEVIADGDRQPSGQFPRGFTQIRLKHVLHGKDLDLNAVKRAIELSDDKYCSVAASLKAKVEIVSVWEVKESPN